LVLAEATKLMGIGIAAGLFAALLPDALDARASSTVLAPPIRKLSLE